MTFRTVAAALFALMIAAACDQRTPTQPTEATPQTPSPPTVAREGQLQLVLTPIASFTVPSHPQGLAFSPDGRYLAVPGYWTQNVDLYDAATFQLVSRRDSVRSIEGVAFTPDGRRLITASKHFTTRVLSIPDLEILAEVAHRGGYVLPHPDGSSFYKSSYNDDDALRVSLDGVILSRHPIRRPWGASLSRDGTSLWLLQTPVTGSPRLVSLEASTLSLKRSLDLPFAPYHVIPLERLGEALVAGCLPQGVGVKDDVMVGRVDVEAGRTFDVRKIAETWQCSGGFGWGAPWTAVGNHAVLMLSYAGLLVVDTRTGNVHRPPIDWVAMLGVHPCCEIAYDAARGRIAVAAPLHGIGLEYQVFVLALSLQWLEP